MTNPNASPRHRRLHLTILVATAVLALNAVAVANGWSPYPVPGQADQAAPVQQPQAASESRPALSTDTRSDAAASGPVERS